MNEIEEKYTRFGLNDEMKKAFQDYSVGIDKNIKGSSSFSVTTFIIERNGSATKAEDVKNAKLV